MSEYLKSITGFCWRTFFACRSQDVAIAQPSDPEISHYTRRSSSCDTISSELNTTFVDSFVSNYSPVSCSDFGDESTLTLPSIYTNTTMSEADPNTVRPMISTNTAILGDVASSASMNTELARPALITARQRSLGTISNQSESEVDVQVEEMSENLPMVKAVSEPNLKTYKSTENVKSLAKVRPIITNRLPYYYPYQANRRLDSVSTLTGGPPTSIVTTISSLESEDFANYPMNSKAGAAYSRINNVKIARAFYSHDETGRMVNCTVVVIDRRSGSQSPLHFHINFENDHPQIFVNGEVVADIQVCNRN